MSPLGWSALSWAIGILIVAPLLTQVAHHLDRGQYQSLILIAATSFGSFFCLLTGFFKTVWVFLFPILYIVVAIIFAEVVHTRNLGLLIHGLTDYDSSKRLLLHRRVAASHLSLYCFHVSHAKAQWP
jgi:integral membrane sensor domain MASE1